MASSAGRLRVRPRRRCLGQTALVVAISRPASRQPSRLIDGQPLRPGPTTAPQAPPPPAMAHARCRRAHRADPLAPRLGAGRDRLVGQPVLDVVGQGPRRRVAIARAAAPSPCRQIASSAGGDCRFDLARRRELPCARPCGAASAGRCSSNGALAGQQAVERRAQAVDVAGRPQLGRAGPRPARGSCTPACRSPTPIWSAARSLPDAGRSVASVARRRSARGRRPWPGPSRRPASRRTGRA